MCFRLDTMVRTWGTAPFARGCSWFYGWKEWSLRWPPLTWGSKHPPLLLWHKKHFLSIWSWGLSHRTLIKKRHKRERERGFLWVIQNRFSLNQKVCCSQVWREEPVKGYKELCVTFRQTPSLIEDFIVWISQGHCRGANKIRKLWKDADNWMIQSTHTTSLSSRRPLPALCVYS